MNLISGDKSNRSIKTIKIRGNGEPISGSFLQSHNRVEEAHHSEPPIQPVITIDDLETQVE